MKRLAITGRVQGVGYRDWLVGEARALWLTGWVRNRRDGSVEAVVAGDTVDALVKRAWRGPMMARVDGVAVSEAVGEAMPVGFERRETA
jgi:acylphosphatase